MKCPNHPGDNLRDKGVCHVCKHRERLPVFLKWLAGTEGDATQEIRFCPGCCHWFCEPCWRRLMGRFTGFIEKWVKGAPAGCCGPKKESQ